MPKAEDGRRLISHSELSTFKACRRKWYLGSYRELRQKREDEIGPLGLGTRVHIGLARYYDPSDPFSTEAALEAYDRSVEESRARMTKIDDETGESVFTGDPDEFQKEAELGRIMLQGYFEWVEEEGADIDWEVVAAESKVRVPLEGIRTDSYDGIDLVGKLDLRIRRRSDGARFFVDHKTTGSLNDIPKWAHIAEQFKHYALLEMLELGNEARTDGGIYNMLRKVKRTSRSNPPFYGRWEVRHNIHELRSYWLRTIRVVEEILTTEIELDEGGDPNYVCPPTPGGDCTWKCDFFAVCGMMDDGSDAEGFIEEMYEVGDMHARYRQDDAGGDASKATH